MRPETKWLTEEEHMSSTYGIALVLFVLVLALGVFSVAFGIAALDLVILVNLFKRRKLTDVCLAIMVVSFIIALLYESQRPLLVSGFFVLYFALPLLNFCYLLRVGRLNSRSARTFEGMTVVAVIPCAFGLYFTLMAQIPSHN